MSQQPLLDPAIIDSSILSISGGPPPASAHQLSKSQGNGGTASLEPGNALSKLLDLAMANAAKELTPEFDSKDGETTSSPSTASPRHSSFLGFVPSAKADTSRVYSIDVLLELRSSAGVASFDQSRLPNQSFWALKAQAKPPKHQQGREPRNQGNRKNRHNNQNNQGNSLSWERKPAGFLKSSEIDSLSTEKISQLLGETADEGVPEWDSLDLTQDLKMDMGLTVEDFERWKQHMREEERRNNEEEFGDSQGGNAQPNEVDSFFSFVKPKNAIPEQHSSNPKSAPDSKSSRFSSFFSGNAASPLEDKAPSLPSASSSTTSVNSIGGDHSLRFFNSQADLAQRQPQRQTPVLSGLQRPGERPGQSPAQMQTQTQDRPPPPQLHHQGQQMPPMGRQHHPVPGPQGGQFPLNGQNPMQGPGPLMHGPPGLGMPLASNESFFFSLMKKSEPAADGAKTLNSPQPPKSQQSPGQPPQSRQEMKFPPAGQQNMPNQYYPYGHPPPGMYQGGMLPPGMNPALQQLRQQPQPGQHVQQPGQQGPLGYPGQQNQTGPRQMQQGPPGLQSNTQGGPNGPQGMNQNSWQKAPPGMGQFPPPGYYMYPHGVPQGMRPPQGGVPQQGGVQQQGGVPQGPPSHLKAQQPSQHNG